MVLVKRFTYCQIFLKILFLGGVTSNVVLAQADIKGVLRSGGFENIRLSGTHDKCLISAENNMYRWQALGLQVLVDSVLNNIATETEISLFILERGIPKIQINIYKGKESSQTSVEVDYINDDTWQRIKNQKPINASFNKADVVFYPQFYLQNVLLSRIYEVQLNIAPAAEISLWKGMQLTGQVIFPVYVDPVYYDDNIRPGFVTLAQQFRLPKNWYGRLVVGNFNFHRYGADFSLEKPINKSWCLFLNAGYTGTYTFENGRWKNNPVDQLTWNIKLEKFYSKYNLQFELSYGQYLNNDRGVRFDCTRHFNETAIGFYAVHTGGQTNGGFHFALPLPTSKRKRRTVRPMLPRYFDWQYNAGTEFFYGQYYETRPNENRVGDWRNPLFIQKQLKI